MKKSRRKPHEMAHEMPHPAMRSKQHRMQMFFDFVKKHGKEYDKTQLLAIYSIQNGITRHTLLSYLHAYIEAKTIVEHGDKILTKPQYLELIEADSQRAHELSGGD